MENPSFFLGKVCTVAWKCSCKTNQITLDSLINVVLLNPGAAKKEKLLTNNFNSKNYGKCETVRPWPKHLNIHNPEIQFKITSNFDLNMKKY